MTKERRSNVPSDVLYLAVCAIKDKCPAAERIAGMDLGRLYDYSSFHNVEPLVGKALLRFFSGDDADGCVDGGLHVETEQETAQIMAKFQEAVHKTARKNLLLDMERTVAEQWLEQNGIWYVSLKGAVLHSLYPTAGLRKMADNDIWFDSAYTEQVRDYFVSQGYRIASYGKANHDVYSKAPVYNFEMHRSLWHEGENKVWDRYYDEIRNRLVRIENREFGYRFSEEDFYVYLIAHAYHHHASDGIGIKIFADLHYYLKANREKMDFVYIAEQMEVLGITEYEETLRGLTEKLLGDERAVLTDAENEMLVRMLGSGAYGTLKNRADGRMDALVEDGEVLTLRLKIKYFFKRFSPDEEFLKAYYPFFYRHKWLRPIGNLWRVVRGIFVHPRVLWREFCHILHKGKE